MSKFKSGDLAVIIGSTVAENIGKTVQLVEFMGSGSFTYGNGDYPEGPARWVVRSHDGSACLAVAKAKSGYITYKVEGLCREAWLMPLCGDLQIEKEKAKGLAQ